MILVRRILSSIGESGGAGDVTYPAIDPATLALALYLEDYAGAPWVGKASAGVSGTKNATEATTPPTVGAAVNSHPTALADGVDDQLYIGAALDFMSDTAWSGWCLLEPLSSAAHDYGDAYNDEGVITDNSGSVGVAFSTLGFTLFRTTQALGWAEVTATMPTGALAVGTFRWDAATNTIAVGVNGPPNHSMHCLPADISLSFRTLSLFRNFNGAARFHGRAASIGIAKAVLTNTQIGGVVAHLRTKFAQPFTRPSNYQAGAFSGGTPAPGATYAGTTKTTTAAFSQRDGARLHFFNGAYYLLGGWNSGLVASWGNKQSTNEIWRSTDLINWTLHVADTAITPATRWSERHAFGTAQIGIYLYVIGADQYVNGIPDVWRTTDCTTWTQMTAAGPWGNKVLICAGQYGTELHVLGGNPYAGGVFYTAGPQHYRSTDGGATWTQLADAPFSTSAINTLVEHEGYLFAIGGNGGGVTGGTRIYSNEVWAWNGSVWRKQRAQDDTPDANHFPGGMWLNAISYDGALWRIMARDTDTTDDSYTAYSRDLGVTWTQIVSPPWALLPSHADGVCATAADGIVVASGFGVDKTVGTLKRVP